MNDFQAEDQWVQETMAGQRIKSVPAAYRDLFEREVYSRISRQEVSTALPVWNIVGLMAFALGVFWVIRMVLVMPAYPEDQSKNRLSVAAKTVHSLQESPVVERSASQSAQNLTSVTVSQPEPLADSAAFEDRLSEDLLLLEMLGEDDDFMQELGTLELDLQLLAQPVRGEVIG